MDPEKTQDDTMNMDYVRQYAHALMTACLEVSTQHSNVLSGSEKLNAIAILSAGLFCTTIDQSSEDLGGPPGQTPTYPQIMNMFLGLTKESIHSARDFIERRRHHSDL